MPKLHTPLALLLAATTVLPFALEAQQAPAGSNLAMRGRARRSAAPASTKPVKATSPSISEGYVTCAGESAMSQATRHTGSLRL